MRRIVAFLSLAVCLWGCRGGGGSFSAAGLDTLYAPAYARGFCIYSCGKESALIEIRNPWQGARGVNQYVFIARGGERPPAGFDGVTIASDPAGVACMSSSHVAFLDALGRTDAIRAVSGARYITSDTIRSREARGLVRDVGYEGNINYELLVMLRPEAIFMYSVAGERLPVIDKMKELGVPVVMIGEYLEPTPLGKAEWLVAFGEVFGCRGRAEAIFADITHDYNGVKALAEDVRGRPRVMLNAPWKDTWFVPGDRSYMVQLLRDAGAQYACAGVDSEQSRAIGAEAALSYASQADYWLNPNDAATVADLVRSTPNLAGIPPVRGGRVYNNTLRATPGGGSDFWESGAVYPNRVLRDLVCIFHPQLLPGHGMNYFKRLE